MQMRIEQWAGKGGKRELLWERVKGAERREGVVVYAGIDLVEGVVKMEVDGSGTHRSHRTKVEREQERCNAELADISTERDRLKHEAEVIAWRERLAELAAKRAERVDECGWDQRLCFGDEEWADFGVGVLESYEEDGESEGQNGEWWCLGKKKCERHAG